MASCSNSPLCNLKDKVVLITGASSGIGAATAVLFAELGAKLALVGRNEDNIKAVSENCIRQQLSFSQEHPLLIIADVTVEVDARRVMDETIAKYGRLDILINSAGILETGSIETTSMEQYDRVMNVNVRAIYHLTMLSVPHLIASKGNIVNVSSVNGVRSFPNVLAYCISKSALDQVILICCDDSTVVSKLSNHYCKLGVRNACYKYK